MRSPCTRDDDVYARSSLLPYIIRGTREEEAAASDITQYELFMADGGGGRRSLFVSNYALRAAAAVVADYDNDEDEQRNLALPPFHSTCTVPFYALVLLTLRSTAATTTLLNVSVYLSLLLSFLLSLSEHSVCTSN